MNVYRPSVAVLLLMALFWMTGCAAPSYDYTAFRESNPLSILILPPLNHSPDVTASYSVLSRLTRPLAESGYYVLPVTVVDETFRQNGFYLPGEIHDIPLAMLRKVFSVDAVLYVDITAYGTVYRIIGSDSQVTLKAHLVDLRTGNTLWKGAAEASTAESRGQSSGILQALVSALVNQITDTLADTSHEMAGIASERLLTAGKPGGILYGPRSPRYVPQ